MKTFIISLLCAYTFINSIHGSIDKKLKYFETLHADDFIHRTVKQGSEKSDHPYNKIKEVEFNALGKNFRVILTPKKYIFHPNLEVSAVDEKGTETPIPINYDMFYDGRVFGELDSHATMSIDDNVVTGNIHLPDESYHIEHAWRHLPNSNNKTVIAYKASDVIFHTNFSQPLNYQNSTSKTCGFNENKLLYGEYKIFGNETTQGTQRVKRNVKETLAMNKTKCSLLLVANYKFFKEIGGGSNKATVNYLISLIDRVNKIFTKTIWTDEKNKQVFTGMGFVIKRIIVHTNYTDTDSTDHYNMQREIWSARHLLGTFSQTNFIKDYCLAHLFTHEVFNKNSIAGLAYKATDELNQSGGICGPATVYLRLSSFRNAGLTTTQNAIGQHIITRQADLITAHELGHNWGADHDESDECSSPASRGGPYLMHPYSLDGRDVNNNKFSPCSIRSISKVLIVKSQQCFIEPDNSLCGNEKVEGDEECDAGFSGIANTDPCCTSDCKLRSGANCSDKNSICCRKCKYMRKGSVCRQRNTDTCEDEAKCTGKSAECPKSLQVPFGTECLDGGECQGGICIPYCEKRGYQSCMCEEMEHSCKQCCRVHMNMPCLHEQPEIILSNGTPCIKGLCLEGSCQIQAVDDMKQNTIVWKFSTEDLDAILLILKDNIVGVVVLLTALIWLPVCLTVRYYDKIAISNHRFIFHNSVRARFSGVVIGIPYSRIGVARMPSEPLIVE